MWATPNFLFATAQDAALSGCMRLPTHFLLFRDGSALLLSERESEHVFEALSAAEASSARHASSGTRSAPPCLANLAFARDVLPGVETELHVPLLLGAPPPDVVWRKAAQSVVALQVFAGETGYRRGGSRGYRLTSNEQDSLRVRLVGEIVLGQGAPIRLLAGQSRACKYAPARFCTGRAACDLACSRRGDGFDLVACCCQIILTSIFLASELCR